MEEWKDIVGYEWLYRISSKWSVLSMHFWKERIMSPSRIYGMYLQLWLNKKWIIKKFYVHRLVAQAFMQNPLNFPCVCHKDETLVNWLLNNSVNNLYYGTNKDNTQDMMKKGRHWTQRQSEQKNYTITQ